MTIPIVRFIDDAPTPWADLMDGEVFIIDAVMETEDDGSMGTYIPQLPGVVSQGRTDLEAMANTRDALLGALAEYRDSSGSVPWQHDAVPGPGQRTFRLMFSKQELLQP